MFRIFCLKKKYTYQFQFLYDFISNNSVASQSLLFLENGILLAKNKNIFISGAQKYYKVKSDDYVNIIVVKSR